MSSNPSPQKLIQGPPHRLLCFQSPDVVVDDRVEECTCISGTQNASVVDTLLLQEHCKDGGLRMTIGALNLMFTFLKTF